MIIGVSGKSYSFLLESLHTCLTNSCRSCYKKSSDGSKVRNEDANHILFDCSFARVGWQHVGLPEVTTDGHTGDVVEFLYQLSGVCSREKLTLIIMVYWNLWYRRNRWVWDRVSISEFGVYEKAKSMLYEWKQCCLELKIYKGTSTVCTKTWKPPEQDWVKINTDAAVFVEAGYTGIGCVLLNERGEFLQARNQRIETVYQPREAEAIGLKKAVLWGKEPGYKQCVFETDAKELVEACKKVQGRAYFHSIVLSCIEYFNYYDKVLVEFVYKYTNEMAHRLVRATYSRSAVYEWIDVAPDFISDVLVTDSI